MPPFVIAELLSGDLTPGQREYQRASAYPDEATSRCLSLGNIWALFKPAAKLEFSVSQLFSRDNADKILSGNILFALLLGAVYGLVLLGALPGIKGSWLALSQQGYGSALLSVMLAFLKGPVSLLGIVVLYVICNYFGIQSPSDFYLAAYSVTPRCCLRPWKR